MERCSDWPLKMEREALMSDGREEREERKLRIEQEKKENSEDRVEPEEADGWEPERQES